MSDAPGSGDADRGGGLPHMERGGRPRMVDVSTKAETDRTAMAEGWIRMEERTLSRLLEEGGAGKGDVLRVGELAGIQAGKRTGELIPLCHLLPAVSVSVELEPDPALPGIRARARARVAGATGVEMEALTAVSLALLTVYDMAKALEKGMEIGGIRLLTKEGGRSGLWERKDTGEAAEAEAPGRS
jgi:cyclic pyranopterin monophosphate synthase